jgi:hypothetical protein
MIRHLRRPVTAHESRRQSAPHVGVLSGNRPGQPDRVGWSSGPQRAPDAVCRRGVLGVRHSRHRGSQRQPPCQPAAIRIPPSATATATPAARPSQPARHQPERPRPHQRPGNLSHRRPPAGARPEPPPAQRSKPRRTPSRRIANQARPKHVELSGELAGHRACLSPAITPRPRQQGNLGRRVILGGPQCVLVTLLPNVTP